MKNKSYDKAIENAVASVEMEGYQIDEQSKEWCKKLLLNEITMEEYIELVKLKSRSNSIMSYSINSITDDCYKYSTSF